MQYIGSQQRCRHVHKTAGHVQRQHFSYRCQGIDDAACQLAEEIMELIDFHGRIKNIPVFGQVRASIPDVDALSHQRQ